MTTQSEHRRDARLLLATWVFLLGLTAGSFWIADVNSAPGAETAAVVLGIAVLKAHLVMGVFMEMREAPRVWMIAMSTFLLALTGALIALF